jgi:hypothetical protein
MEHDPRSVNVSYHRARLPTGFEAASSGIHGAVPSPLTIICILKAHRSRV